MNLVASSVLMTADLSASLRYDALGRIVQQTTRDSATKVSPTTTLSYDSLGKEMTRTTTGSDGNTTEKTLTWSADNQLTKRVTRSDGVDVLIDYTAVGSMLPRDAYEQEITAQRYVFDALNNLIDVTTILKDNSQDVATYNYSNVDDPTQLTSVVHTHSAYPLTITLTYDVDGRMTKDETVRALHYDAAGRLSSVG